MKSYTDISQSKKLADILPLESADMCYINGSVGKIHIGGWKDEMHDEDDLPCWSLAALLSVIPGGQVNRMANSDKWEASSWNDSGFGPAYYVEDYDNPIDACYNLILELHELNLL